MSIDFTRAFARFFRSFVSPASSRLHPPAFVCILMSGALPLGAEITFKTTRVLLQPRPDQEEVEAVFDFSNPSASPLRLLAADSGCTCLKTTFTSGEIPAGGSGRVAGVFRTTNQPGIVEKTIQVRVDENGKHRVIPLTVAVEMPELVKIEPRTLAWNAGGESGEQSFTVKMSGEKPILLREVTSSQPGFEIRMETVTEGAEYRVHVKPADTAKPLLGIFHFKTDCEIPRFSKPIAFAHVRKN
jgi:hypothetical protein